MAKGSIFEGAACDTAMAGKGSTKPSGSTTKPEKQKGGMPTVAYTNTNRKPKTDPGLLISYTNKK